MNSQELWKNKILSWEKKRYGFGMFLNPFSWSVRERLFVSQAFIKKNIENQSHIKINELGCGSAVLMRPFSALESFSYLGMDISSQALSRAAKQLPGKNFQFVVQDVEEDFILPPCDLLVMLGLSDWIKPQTLLRILTQTSAQRVLISYTSTTFMFKNTFYLFYRKIFDRNFKALSYSDNDFLSLCHIAGWDLVEELTTKNMQPGKLLCLKKTISNQ